MMSSAMPVPAAGVGDRNPNTQTMSSAVPVPAAGVGDRNPNTQTMSSAVPVPAAGVGDSNPKTQTMSYAVPVPVAGPSAQPLANPVTVVSSQFHAAYPVDLVITEKMLSIKEGDFTVSDVSGNLIFKIKGSLFSLHDQRVLVDSADTPILTLRQKILTAHRRWQVYRGQSSDPKDLLFIAKKSSLLQLKTELDIFLAGNTEEEVHDFKVKGSWGQRSCTIYTGDNTIIAQMHKKHDVQSILFGRDAFGVTVYPHVDYAFIVAVVVVLHEINMDRSGED